MDALERARRYLSKLESPRRAKSDPQDSHAVVFGAAVILVQGFAFDERTAMELLAEYCHRSDEPWTERELHHKLAEAAKANPRQRRGWLAGSSAWRPNEEVRGKLALPPLPKPKYDATALEKVAGDLAGKVDLLWLANRSRIDPATVDSTDFLNALYDCKKERVVVFNVANGEGQPYTQGEALWPAEKLPAAGRHGVWFLAAPVDGKWYETDRLDSDGSRKMTRRSGCCVTSWRWMVVESDDAPPAAWLGALARLPLKIGALYTSGGRSIHALVRTPARTKEEWDEFRDALRPSLILLGADPGCMSAVRLTRLPGCYRQSKGAFQKLLYLDPEPDRRPLVEMPRLRDVEDVWTGHAAAGPADCDETGGAWIAAGLKYYASRSSRCRGVLGDWRKLGR